MTASRCLLFDWDGGPLLGRSFAFYMPSLSELGYGRIRADVHASFDRCYLHRTSLF
jgi:hypothetical protein